MPVLRTTKCDAFSEARRTKNRLLRYGIRIRCSKRLPVVLDAFSETFGDKKGLLWYATHLQRCAKQPPAPPNAFSKAQKRHPAPPNASSKARRTADSIDCGQPPAAPDAFSEACRAKSSICPPDAASVRERAPALFVHSGGPFPCPFDGTRYRKQPTARRYANIKRGSPLSLSRLFSHPLSFITISQMIIRS